MGSFQRILKLGCTLVTLQDSQSYTWNSVKDNFGQLIVSLSIMARAHEESRMKAARLSASWVNKRKLAAESKTPITARTPAWIALKGGRYEVVKARARTVLMIYKWTASGQGKSQVARRLNQQAVPVIGRATSWHPSYVEKLLTTRAVLGECQPHRLDMASGRRRRVPEGDAIANMWPAIIPAALFLKVQRGRQLRRIPAGPRGSRGGQAQVSNLFTGLLRCGCGGSIYLVNKGRDRTTGVLAKFLDCSRRLRGERCTFGAWPYLKAEALIITALRNAIPWSQAVPQERSAHQTAIAQLEEELASLLVEQESVTVKLGRLVEAVETGARVDALVARITTLQGQTTALAERETTLRETLTVERERLRASREVVEARHEAFEAYRAGRLADGDHRARLALVLRELLLRITLAGPKDRRRVTFTMADGEDMLFHVADDLSTAAQEGDDVEDEEPTPTVRRWPASKKQGKR